MEGDSETPTYTQIAQTGITGEIELMPVSFIAFCEATDSEEYTWHSFFVLEKESAWNFKPITRPSFEGGSITLGYKFEGTFYIPQNQYSDNGILAELNAFIVNLGITASSAAQAEGDRPRFELVLGDCEVLSSGALGLEDNLPSTIKVPWINSTSAMRISLDNTSVTYEIESIEYRPRMIIRVTAITGLLTTDIFRG